MLYDHDICLCHAHATNADDKKICVKRMYSEDMRATMAKDYRVDFSEIYSHWAISPEAQHC